MSRFKILNKLIPPYNSNFWYALVVGVLTLCALAIWLPADSSFNQPPISGIWTTGAVLSFFASCCAVCLLLNSRFKPRPRLLQLFVLAYVASATCSLILAYGKASSVMAWSAADAFIAVFLLVSLLANRRGSYSKIDQTAVQPLGGVALVAILIAASSLPNPSIEQNLLCIALIAAVSFLWISRSTQLAPPLSDILRLTAFFLIATDFVVFWAVFHAQQIPAIALLFRIFSGGLLALPALWHSSILTPRSAIMNAIAKLRHGKHLVRRELFQSEKVCLTQWQACNAINSLASSRQSLTEFVSSLVNEAAKIFPDEAVFASLLEGQPPTMTVATAHSWFNLSPLPLDKHFMVNNYLAGEPVIIDNILSYEGKLPPDVVKSGAKSMAGVPIIYNEKLHGILEIYSRQPRAFSIYTTQILALFADKAVGVIARTQSDDCLAKQSTLLNLLNEIIEITAQQPSPSILMSKVSEKLSSFLDADAVAAFLTEREGSKTRLGEALSKNFSPEDMRHLKDIFAQDPPRWLLEYGNRPTSEQGMVRLSLLKNKTIEVLPLYSRQNLLGIIILLWDYNRKEERDSYVDDTLRSIVIQVAVNLERQHLFDSVQKIGLTDALTSLSNRRFFDYVLKREINRAVRYNHPLCLLMLDIDHFKAINDTFGHVSGDIALKELGQLMRQSFRSADILCRYGGEEFAIILPETHPYDAYILAEKFREKIMNAVIVESPRLTFTISIGLAAIELGAHNKIESPTDLLLAADRCLYRAKQSGRNRTVAWRQIP